MGKITWPVHQRSEQSLLDVVGGEDQQHGVPGQTLKTGDTAGLSGGQSVTEGQKEEFETSLSSLVPRC